MADDLDNTNPRWLVFPQSLARLRQNRHGATDEWAFIKLQRALIEELCEASEGVPINKFRYPWSGRMVDLVVLLRKKYLTLADIRWPNVECNLDWLNRDWPLPALEAEAAPTPAADATPKPIGPATTESAPVAPPATEASVTEPEPAACAEELTPELTQPVEPALPAESKQPVPAEMPRSFKPESPETVHVTQRAEESKELVKHKGTRGRKPGTFSQQRAMCAAAINILNNKRRRPKPRGRIAALARMLIRKKTFKIYKRETIEDYIRSEVRDWENKNPDKCE